MGKGDGLVDYFAVWSTSSEADTMDCIGISKCDLTLIKLKFDLLINFNGKKCVPITLASGRVNQRVKNV